MSQHKMPYVSSILTFVWGTFKWATGEKKTCDIPLPIGSMYGIFTYVNGWAFMVNVGTVKIPYMDPMGYTDCLSRDLYHNGLWHKRPKPKTIPIQNVEFFILMFVHRMLSVHPDQKLNIRSLNHPAGLSTCCYIQSMLSWECKGIRLQSLAQQKPESPWVGPLIIPMMVMLVSKDMFECWNKVKLGNKWSDWERQRIHPNMEYIDIYTQYTETLSHLLQSRLSKSPAWKQNHHPAYLHTDWSTDYFLAEVGV